MAERYYTEKLAAERLMRCYAVAPPAARAYLQGEIDFLLAELSAVELAPDASRCRVLELGCGFGRVLRPLLERAGRVWGIDTSLASLAMAREFVAGGGRLHLAAMDAARLAFADSRFDAVLCIQNGISAFAGDPLALMREALRATRPGGRIFFSSYAERFWPERLRWFEAQAAAGLWARSIAPGREAA
ncbi:MAG: class I SAM-dependent methyltransferase [Candidatus Eisenbacteria bacterium]|uniref:Class I SAM-dependent methyltransferase n=1 Tax=Eiseniibacteriota bacterium TaxID=2212470 RepID=A0A937XEG7_UNCEI|nr:class I SAM-dependent methyltransferase [Candidatus Eisenbacteria bacterium]